MRKRATITAAALLGTAGIGLGAAQLAMADPSASPSAPSSSSSSASSTATSSTPDGPGGGQREDVQPGGRGHGIAGVDVSDLATKLGIDQTKVNAAVKAAQESTRTSLPTRDDSATDAQREAARTAHQQAFVKALAKNLGIDESKVTAAVTALQAEHRAEELAALKTKLAAAVKAGTLSQSESDAVVKAYRAGIITGAESGGARR